MEERHLSLSEAAEALNISERTAYRWIKSGKLRAYKPGRDYWIPESAIKEVVEESVVRPKARAARLLEPSFNDVLAEERQTVEDFPAEQVAAFLAENERDKERIRQELEKMSPADLREAMLAVSPALRRYYREESASREDSAERVQERPETA